MREIVADFLANFGHPRDDEPVIEYLSMLIEQSDGAEMAEVSCEFLEGASPAFAEKEEGEKLPSVLALYEKLHAASAPQPGPQAAGPSAAQVQAPGPQKDGAGSCTAQSKGLPPMKRLSLSRTSDQSASSSARPSDDDDVSDQGRGPDPNVEQLQVLCPCPLDACYLSYLLSLHRGLEAAADFVVEVGDSIKRHEEGWLRAREAARQERAEQELLAQQNRDKILQRYDLEALKTVPAGCKKPSKKGEPLLPPSAPEKEPQCKVRYLNGVPVFTKKGEKFVTEVVKEDWDGGSKGKVYTKGKRGKGYVGG